MRRMPGWGMALVALAFLGLGTMGNVASADCISAGNGVSGDTNCGVGSNRAEDVDPLVYDEFEYVVGMLGVGSGTAFRLGQLA